jgi:hypothetical protein
MVQDYLLGGYNTTKPIDEWLNGFDFDVIDQMKEGDFFLGVDVDLVKKVTPIFSTANPEITSGEVRIDTGSNDKQECLDLQRYLLCKPPG